MTGPLFLEGDWWEREGEVYNLHKNKLKSEVFNRKKKILSKKVFVITMNSNWENFNLEFITFIFEYIWASQKNLTFRRG